jgi:hypothetical protein
VATLLLHPRKCSAHTIWLPWKPCYQVYNGPYCCYQAAYAMHSSLLHAAPQLAPAQLTCRPLSPDTNPTPTCICVVRLSAEDWTPGCSQGAGLLLRAFSSSAVASLARASSILACMTMGQALTSCACPGML